MGSAKQSKILGYIYKTVMGQVNNFFFFLYNSKVRLDAIKFIYKKMK